MKITHIYKCDVKTRKALPLFLSGGRSGSHLIDPVDSLENINTPQDYQKARQLIAKGSQRSGEAEHGSNSTKTEGQ